MSMRLRAIDHFGERGGPRSQSPALKTSRPEDLGPADPKAPRHSPFTRATCPCLTQCRQINSDDKPADSCLVEGIILAELAILWAGLLHDLVTANNTLRSSSDSDKAAEQSHRDQVTDETYQLSSW